MKFNKYNSYTQKGYVSGSFSAQNSSSSSSSSSVVNGGGNVDIERFLWGQWDNGEDINGNIYCQNGNIFVTSQEGGRVNNEDEEDTEDRTAGEERGEGDDDAVNVPNYDTGNLDDIFEDEGNMYVEKVLRVGKIVETNEVVADKHIVRGGTKNQIMLADGTLCDKGRFTIDYIDLVDIEGTIGLQGDEGVSVALYDYPTSPKFKFSAVPATTETVGGVKVGSGLTIEKDGTLSTDLDEIKDLIASSTPHINLYGSITQPVVLFSGVIKRTNRQTPIVWSWQGNKLDCIDDNIVVSADKGDLTFRLRPNDKASKIIVTSATATQYISGDLEDITETSHSGSNSGAHWFEVRALENGSSYVVHVREIHKTNSNNESWATNDWEENQGSIYGVNVAVFGYCIPTNGSTGNGGTGNGSSSNGGNVDISDLIVQTKGDSQTKVMSQKAVTDELNTLSSSLSSKVGFDVLNGVMDEIDAKKLDRELAQETGDNEAIPMSQKAVTDAIPLVLNSIGTSTKNVMSQKATTDAIYNAFNSYTFGGVLNSIPSKNIQRAFIDLSANATNFSFLDKFEAGQKYEVIVHNVSNEQITISIPTTFVCTTTANYYNIRANGFHVFTLYAHPNGTIFIDY